MTKQYGPLSLNEILFFFTRATVGAGAPFGVGEDIAKAAIYLAEADYDPAPIVIAALDHLYKKTSSPVPLFTSVKNQTVLRADDGGPLSTIFAAPAVSDWLLTHADNPDASLKIYQVDCPVLLIAAIEALGRGPYLWNISHLLANDEQDPIINSADIEEIQTPADLIFTPSSTANTIYIRDKDTALVNGTLIDGASWADIQVYFTRCLVPSTDQSRNSGAGAGLVDDD